MSKSALRVLAAVLGLLVASAASAPTLIFKFKTIEIPGAYSTEVNGINNLGVMVGGYSDNNDTGTHGFILIGGKVITIDDPKAAQDTACSGINNSGSIVGTYLDYAGNWRAFLYEDGTFSDIDPPGSTSAFANAINDYGKIVGRYTDPSGTVHGFLWNGTSYETIDAPGATFSDAVGINNADTIVVDWSQISPHAHSSLYNGSQFKTIDVPGAYETYAGAINNRGDVVFSWVSKNYLEQGAVLIDGKYYKFTFSPDTYGLGINDRHVIVGLYNNGYSYRLTY
jgi:probable HAF family extracellular repeat protein